MQPREHTLDNIHGVIGGHGYVGGGMPKGFARAPWRHALTNHFGPPPKPARARKPFVPKAPAVIRSR
jgi:hypothetical protein